MVELFLSCIFWGEKKEYHPVLVGDDCEVSIFFFSTLASSQCIGSILLFWRMAEDQEGSECIVKTIVQ